jgi:membrane protein involved in colicin uptake
MGGKGGGGSGGNWQDVYATDPKTGGVLADASGNLVTKAAYAQQQKDEADKKAADDAAALKAATPAAEAAPAAAEPEAAAPVADTSPPRNDTLAPSLGGGAVDTADPAAPGGAGSGVNSTGDTLGGSILNPPKYWTGTIDKFKSGSTSRGKMTTTQT